MYVDLATLGGVELVLPTVARALGVTTTDRQTIAAHLGRYLQPRQLLLVLDNVEHVLSAAPQLGQLLAVAHHDWAGGAGPGGRGQGAAG